MIALDGLRATGGMSGWRRQTNISGPRFARVNVVQPIGGLASFYTDWDHKPENKQKFRYRWTCRLNKIIKQLDARNGRGSVAQSTPSWASRWVATRR